MAAINPPNHTPGFMKMLDLGKQRFVVFHSLPHAREITEVRTFLPRGSSDVFKEENGTSGTEVEEFLPKKDLPREAAPREIKSPNDLVILNRNAPQLGPFT